MNTTIKKFHRLSGIVIACFLLLHIGNHLFALGGSQLHIDVMNLFRYVYRFLPIEILLLMCVIFQIISGVKLVFTKGFRKQPVYVVIQILSGLYLSLFMTCHVRDVMLGRYVWNADTNFYFVADVTNSYPSKLFFIPYYMLSLVCVFAHIACVHYMKRVEKIDKMNEDVTIAVFKEKIKKETRLICIAGAVITFLIMIAFSGVLYDIK